MLVDWEDKRPEGQERTVLLDKVDAQVSSESVTQEVGRENRKLAGWLVSYTLNPLGMDFRLYEGKNYIGTEASCSVCLSDESVSGMHALILFRAGKFKIRDNLCVPVQVRIAGRNGHGRGSGQRNATKRVLEDSVHI